MTTLNDIKEYYQEVFYVEDPFIIDLAIAVALGIHTQSDPVWLMIVGGSSSGKSEIVNMLGEAPKVFQVSSLTENTFLSGMKAVDGKEVSLLKRMGKKGVLCMKDYTSILSMRAEKRDLIASQMREIYDGYITKPTGNGQNPEWRGKVNFIGGVTDSIYGKDGESAGMGRRAIMYVMPKQDRMKTLRRSLQNTNDGEEKREKIKKMVGEYILQCSHDISVKLPPVDKEFSEELMELANFSTQARSPTDRNFKDNLTLVHDPEMPMRVSQQIHTIAQIIGWMHGGLPEYIKDGIRKITIDNIPKGRRETVLETAKWRGVTSKGLAHELDYPSDTVKLWLEDLNVLGILKREIHGVSKMDIFRMKEEHRGILIKHFKMKTIDDDLLGLNEENDGASSNNYDVDAEIAVAEQRKNQQAFDELSGLK